MVFNYYIHFSSNEIISQIINSKNLFMLITYKYILLLLFKSIISFFIDYYFYLLIFYSRLHTKSLITILKW